MPHDHHLFIWKSQNNFITTLSKQNTKWTTTFVYIKEIDILLGKSVIIFIIDTFNVYYVLHSITTLHRLVFNTNFSCLNCPKSSLYYTLLLLLFLLFPHPPAQISSYQLSPVPPTANHPTLLQQRIMSVFVCLLLFGTVFPSHQHIIYPITSSPQQSSHYSPHHTQLNRSRVSRTLPMIDWIII